MIIGIAGASGSGKTTLARAFTAELSGAECISTDAYYRDLSGLDLSARDAVNFDHPDAADWPLLIEHLSRLNAGLSADTPSYDFATHTRMLETVRVSAGRGIVLEGIFALWHPRVRELLDLSVFVQTDEAICLERRTRRDVVERGRTTESVHAQWERHTAPMFQVHIEPTREYADFVVDGTIPPDGEVRRLLQQAPETA